MNVHVYEARAMQGTETGDRVDATPEARAIAWWDIKGRRASRWSTEFTDVLFNFLPNKMEVTTGDLASMAPENAFPSISSHQNSKRMIHTVEGPKGWRMEAWETSGSDIAWHSSNTHLKMVRRQVIRFTAPDGFRWSVLTANAKDSSVFGRASLIFGTHVFQGGTPGNRPLDGSRVFDTDAIGLDVKMLTDAVRNPAKWWGEYEYAALPDVAHPWGSHRALLTWAGYYPTAHDADLYLTHNAHPETVRRWTNYGVTSPQALTDLSQPNRQPLHDGRPFRREIVVALVKAGVSPDAIRAANKYVYVIPEPKMASVNAAAARHNVTVVDIYQWWLTYVSIQQQIVDEPYARTSDPTKWLKLLTEADHLPDPTMMAFLTHVVGHPEKALLHHLDNPDEDVEALRTFVSLTRNSATAGS